MSDVAIPEAELSYSELDEQLHVLHHERPTLHTERVTTTFYVVDDGNRHRPLNYTVDKAEALSLLKTAEDMLTVVIESLQRKSQNAITEEESVIAQVRQYEFAKRLTQMVEHGITEHTGEVTLYHYSVPMVQTHSRQSGTSIDPLTVADKIEAGYELLFQREQQIAKFFGYSSIAEAAQESYIKPLMEHQALEDITVFHNAHFDKYMEPMKQIVGRFLNNQELSFRKQGVKYEQFYEKYTQIGRQHVMRILYSPILRMDTDLRSSPLEWTLLHERSEHEFYQVIEDNVGKALKQEILNEVRNMRAITV